MESLSRSNSKGGQPHVLVPLKQRRSGYEPSDTETEWQESPWHDHNNRNNGTSDLVEADNIKSNLPRNLSPLKLSRRQIPKVDYDKGSPPRTNPLLRRHGSSKSPYKTRRDDGRNISPLPKPEHRRHVSPYKQGRVEHTLNDGTGNGEIAGLNMKQSCRSHIMMPFSKAQSPFHPVISSFLVMLQLWQCRRKACQTMVASETMLSPSHHCCPEKTPLPINE